MQVEYRTECELIKVLKDAIVVENLLIQLGKVKQKVQFESEPFPTASWWRCIEFFPPSIPFPSVPRVQIENRAHGADVVRKTCSNSWDWSVVPCQTCRVATPTQNFALWHGAQIPPRVYPDESRGSNRSSDDETHQRLRCGMNGKWDCGVVILHREGFWKYIVESWISVLQRSKPQSPANA